MRNRSSSLKQRLKSGIPIAAAALVLGGSANAEVCLVNGRPTAANLGGTWPAGISSAISGSACLAGDDVVMAGRIFVAGGTVTVTPGTIVRGMTRIHDPDDGAMPTPTLSTLGAPGALIITQNGQIESDGDSGSPVIYTTAAVDNDSDGVPDDLNSDGFLDAWPGFDAPCTCSDQAGAGLPAPFGTVACTGPDQLLGTGDDTLGSCLLRDDDARVFPAGAAVGGCVAAGTCASTTAFFYDDTPATNPLSPINPVTDDANVSLWGGVVILGNAPVNFDSTAAGGDAGRGFIEGVTIPDEPIEFATCGGVMANDYSGFVEFSSIRHGGDELGEGNELNGLTMCGVGTATRIEFTEVYTNFDDGFEFFGGTNYTNNLNVSFAGDDQFDVDWGHTGIHQFWFAQHMFFNQYSGVDADSLEYGSESGDNLGEWDGDDFDDGGAPVVVECGPITATTLTGAGEGGIGPSACPSHHQIVYNMTGLSNDLETIGIPGAYAAPEYDPNADECDGDATVVTPGEPPCCNVGPAAADEFCTAADNDGLLLRNGWAGELRNSLILNTGVEDLVVVAGLPAGNAGTPGYSTPQNICNHDGKDVGLKGAAPGFGSLARIISSTLADGDALPGGPGGGGPNAGSGAQACVGDASDLVVNGDEYSTILLGLSVTRKTCVDDGTPNGGDSYIDGTVLPGIFPGLVNEDITFDPQGFGKSGKLLNAAETLSVKATPMDPLLALGTPRCATVVVPVQHPGVTGREAIGGPRNGESTLIRGAFPPGVTPWTTGWTALSIGGVMTP